MRTTTPPIQDERTIRGQRRHYQYAADTLSEIEVFSALSVGAHASAQALSDINVRWDREQHNRLVINFTCPDDEQYEAAYVLYLDYNMEFAVEQNLDVGAAREIASMCREAYPIEWQTDCTIVRLSDKIVMSDDFNCGHLNGRPVVIGDIRPALAAIHEAVCATSDRIESIREPGE